MRERTEIQILRELRDEQLSKLRKKELQLDIAKEALQFYANEDNYISRPVGYSLMTNVEMDAGLKARAALEPTQEF